MTLGSVEDTLFTRGVTLTMDWDPEGTPLSASYNTKRVGVTGIQSTTWESVANGAVLDNNPEDCGDGKRIYPETDLSGTLKNTVNVRVTLENAIPEGMTGSLRLMVLDPMNQCKDGNNESVGSFSSWQHDSWQCDNYGSYTLTNSLYFTEETISNTALLTITQANPGDNYIIVASPDDNLYEHAFIYIGLGSTTDYKTPYILTSDGSAPVPAEQKTELLTVWRTLWLEVDQLKYGDEVAEEPAWNGINMVNIHSELQKACISVNIVPATANSNKIINTNSRAIEHTSFYYDVNNKRDIANTASFWSIQMVMAFSRVDSTVNSAILGTAYNNIIYIFNDTIEENIDINKDVVILHEIVHALGYGHDEQENVLMNPDVSFNSDNLQANHNLLARYIRCIQSQNKPVLVL